MQKFNGLEVPELGQISLQRLSPVHAAQRLGAVLDSLADSESAFHWCSMPYTAQANRAHLARCVEHWSLMREFAFAAVNPRDGCFVGEVALDDVDLVASSANLSYWIIKAARGRGYASIAAAAAARFAFHDLGLRELRIVVTADNVASLRVVARLAASPVAPPVPAQGGSMDLPGTELRFVLDDRHRPGLLCLDPGGFAYRCISQGTS